MSSAVGERRGGRTKVLFVIDNMRRGGTELNAVRTAERLDRSRFEVGVLCLNGTGPLTARYEAGGMRVETMALQGFHGLSMLRCGWRFIRHVRTARPDIVHAHDVYSNIFVAVWTRLARGPVTIASRRWWHSFPNWKLQRANRWAFSVVDAVLANSTQVARSVMEEGRTRASKVWTIPNFADDEAFRPVTDAERCVRRHEWGAPDEVVVIGCVARLDPVKDHATLLRAVSLLRHRGRPVHLVLIGDGPERGRIESLVKELELTDAVHLAGELDGRENLHRGIDVSVLASVSEGFPNSIVEAMAAGNPTVATAVGGCMDAIEDGRTGFLVPPGDAHALADALERLVDDPGLRARMGRAALERARDTFSAASVIRDLERMYLRLVAAAPRQPRGET